MNFEKIYLEEVDSTNEFVKRLENQLSIDYNTSKVFFAGYQTKGKGAGENEWESNKNENLLFTIALKTSIDASNQFLLSKIVSLALIDLLASYNLKAKIKWPNDILIDRKKIAGILIENSVIGDKLSFSAIGIGLNINQKIFSTKIKATSLALELKENFDIIKVLDDYLTKFNFWYSQISENEIIDNIYFSNLIGIDQFFEYKYGNDYFDAIIEKIDSFGRLVLVDRDNQKFVFGFKQVEMIY